MRLAAAIRDLRKKAGLTTEAFARLGGLQRLDITRIETAFRLPDINKVMNCLEAAAVPEDSQLWRTLIRVARDATRKGWWDADEYKDLDTRQKRCADVESGSVHIRHYHNNFVPWMMQLPEYIQAREAIGTSDGIAVIPVSGRARLERQAFALRDGGPQIDILLEEQVVRRSLVPASVMARQLEQMAAVAREHPRVSLRVVPVEGTLNAVAVPLMPFDVHHFADPGDGLAMVTSSWRDDEIVYDQAEVARYVRLFDGLRETALPETDSAEFISKHAAKLAAKRKGR